jgi:hypothetical protein
MKPAIEDGEYIIIGHEAPTEAERELLRSPIEKHTQKDEPEQITCGQGRFL